MFCVVSFGVSKKCLCVISGGVVKGANPVSVFKGSFCRPSIECLWGFDLMRRDGSRVAGVRGVVCVSQVDRLRGWGEGVGVVEMGWLVRR